MVFNRLCKHFSDNCAPLSSANSATSSSANSATWSKYNSFYFFNGCHEFLIISDPFWSLFIAHSRSIFYRLEHSLALTIINQAIIYQTTVVIRIQTQIKSNNSNSKSNSNILKYGYTYRTNHTVLSQNWMSTIKCIRSSCISFWTHACLAHNMYHTDQILSLNDNDSSSSF